MRESSAATALAVLSTRSCAWIAVVEAHRAAIRSPSHSSMKAENWFQLRIVGVTAIRAPGFGRTSSIAECSRAPRCDLCLRGCRSCEHGSCKCLRTQHGNTWGWGVQRPTSGQTTCSPCHDEHDYSLCGDHQLERLVSRLKMRKAASTDSGARSRGAIRLRLGGSSRR